MVTLLLISIHTHIYIFTNHKYVLHRGTQLLEDKHEMSMVCLRETDRESQSQLNNYESMYHLQEIEEQKMDQQRRVEISRQRLEAEQQQLQRQQYKADQILETQRQEIEQRELERLEAERIEAKRIEAERLEAERLQAERLEAERLEAERLQAERLEAERLEAERLQAERLQAERLQAERLQAERLQAERLQAERLQAERLQAERLEAERLEAERLQAERLQAERLQAERLQAERLQAERFEAQRMEAELNTQRKLQSSNFMHQHHTSPLANTEEHLLGQSLTVNTKEAISVVQGLWQSPDSTVRFRSPPAPPRMMDARNKLPFDIHMDSSMTQHAMSSNKHHQGYNVQMYNDQENHHSYHASHHSYTGQEQHTYGNHNLQNSYHYQMQVQKIFVSFVSFEYV